MSGQERVPFIEGQQEFELGTEMSVLYPLTEAPEWSWVLPPYSGNTPCQKCGEDSPYVKYHKDVANFAACYQYYLTHRPSADTLKPFPEHFDRRCSKCSYEWVEHLRAIV